MPIIDPESDVIQEQFALVYAPKRGGRKTRFPKNCVEIFPDWESLIKRDNQEAGYHPARVLGPSKSSEGLMMYYLVEWLD